MHTRLTSLLMALVATVAALAALGGRPATAAPTAQTAMAEEGLVCTTSPTGSFTLDAVEGYINLSDGNVVYMWGYAANGGAFQYPGPVLCVNEGDTVTITLNNTLRVASSIVFPGQEQVLANGAPAQPQFGPAGALTSLTQAAPANGGSMTYSFVAGKPGTYLYHSGTDAAIQQQMGLLGALIVRPAMGANYAYNRADSAFAPGREYLMLFTDIDPYLHLAVERGAKYDMSRFVTRYWLINGRSFPDTIAPNGAVWLPDQPYGSMTRIQPYDAATNPLPALVRYIGAASDLQPFHPHGNHSLVIARDGQPLEGPAGEDLSMEKFSLPIAPGQTWDVLFKWEDVEQYNPATNPIPYEAPPISDIVNGQYYSGDPYLGTTGSMLPGAENYNQCGEYYHVAHNHALNALTAWGVTMQGQITYTRIDPPGGCPLP
jgi:FtsP/CotA-like multicopper oxidase with cupredoxin domain